MDHDGEDGLRTLNAARAKIDRLLATQERLLRAVSPLEGLSQWQEELVRSRQECDAAPRPLDDLVELLVDGDEDTRAIVEAGFAAWESLLAMGITRMRDNGELRQCTDPSRLATGMMAALQGGLLLARTTRDVRRLEVALDMALNYVRAHAVT
ncbi:MAG: TetR family transcriptional regulator C-terminal domain-containing protein [Candidatus Limnocylindria bacterium]